MRAFGNSHFALMPIPDKNDTIKQIVIYLEKLLAFSIWQEIFSAFKKNTMRTLLKYPSFRFLHFPICATLVPNSLLIFPLYGSHIS